ncbi:MAG: alginate O-acetyltransferase complex protein AlgI [Gammaproteobacteria bacterium]|jgi:alginate O-acetyltransferase complex protein AlgI
MLFNSLTFVLLHIVVICAYWWSPRLSARLFFLSLGSFIFYGWFYWPGIFIIAGSIIANYFLGIKIGQTQSKNWVALAVVLNLLSLSSFKYINFLTQSLSDLFSFFNVDVLIPVAPQWLPLGISFFTFQLIAYLVDVYRGKSEAEKNFLVFTCFVSFYGQLIAGPIVRSHEFLPQIKTKQVFSGEKMQLGVFYFISGLMLKVCVADTLAQFVDHGFGDIAALSTNMAWVTIYAFAVQILCDFWGYSTIALGSAYMLGFNLPINFDSPYGSVSLKEFWRRWHITLSSWLKDYLYIPLGGNRKKAYRNLILTMTLGGLWHGASWNFVIWGFLHGTWLAVEKSITLGKSHPKKIGFLSGLIKKLLVFHGVCLLWVLFRATTLNDSLLYFQHLLLPPYDLSVRVPSALSTTLLLFLVFHNKLAQYLVGDKFLRISLTKQVLMSLFIILTTLAYSQARLDFIYFVF